MNLYEISTKAREISFALETGELTPELENELIINQTDLQNKATNYGYVIKSFEDDIEAIDNEMKRLKALKDAKTKAIDRLKSSVLDALHLYRIENIKTPTLSLSIRRSESVEVDSLESLPDYLKNEKVTVTPDKVAIKNAIKKGENISGARIVENFNLQIK